MQLLLFELRIVPVDALRCLGNYCGTTKAADVTRESFSFCFREFKMSLTGHRSENTWSAKIMLKVTGSALRCYAKNCNVNVSFTDVSRTSLPEVSDQKLRGDTVVNMKKLHLKNNSFVSI